MNLAQRVEKLELSTVGAVSICVVIYGGLPGGGVKSETAKITVYGGAPLRHCAG